MLKPAAVDLKPYLKLMLEKNAEHLLLKVDSPILLCWAGEKKPLGKTELTDSMTDQIAFSLLTEKEKNTLINTSKITINHITTDGDYFNVHIQVEDNGLSLFIRPCTANEISEIKDNIPISVLGKEPTGDLDLLPYLKKMVELGASDLFLTVDSPVRAKVYGKLVKLDGFLLTPELTKSAALSIMSQEQIDEFQANKDLDFAISIPNGKARFRANAFYQRQTVGLALRLIPMAIPTVDELGLPDILLELVMAKRGLVLMVGATGSGKSTTLAAMINHRNANSAGHILTIEDPVEFSHPNLKCIVNQREIGIDTSTYARALKASMREAPDVILIGEIRDRETMEAALELSNTGHLCLSTLHANNANQAMERIINMFPHVQHRQLFMDIATNLRGVVSQRLIPDLQGKRSAAMEVMINTPHVSNLILKGELNEIKEAMKTSGSKGMKTFDEALHDLYKAGKISIDEALKNADSRNDLEAKLTFG